MQCRQGHRNSDKTTVLYQFKQDKEYLSQTVLTLCHPKQKEILI